MFTGALRVGRGVRERFTSLELWCPVQMSKAATLATETHSHLGDGYEFFPNHMC